MFVGSYKQSHFVLVGRLLGAYVATFFVSLLPYVSELFGPDSSLRLLRPPFLTVFALGGALPWLVIGALSSVSFALGIHSRLAALAAWVVWCSVYAELPHVQIPSQGYVGWLLLVYALTPAPDSRWTMPRVTYVAAWAILALGYTLSGLDKLRAESWRNGCALAEALASPIARDGSFTHFVLQLPAGLQRFLTRGIAVFEACAVPLCVYGKTRQVAWVLFVMMHIAIIVLLRLTSVAAAMLIFHAFVMDPRLQWSGFRPSRTPLDAVAPERTID